MDTIEMFRRISGERVAHLATIGRDGSPHIVAITFALHDDALYFAVDDKPKKSVHLKRLRNIELNPAVSVLVDHYEDDWTKLWWVRVDGTAHTLIEGPEFHRALALLSDRYEQYGSTRLIGPVVAIAIERMSGWSAS
jgi:PPOX class probable F420-dependent enzyme